MSIEFTNLNQCFSVTQAFGSVGATQLSSFPCTEVFIDNISGESNSNTIICNYLSSNQIINQQFESNLFNKKLYGDIPSNNFTASTIIIGDISQNPYLSSDTSPYPYPPFGFHGHFCEFILFNRNLTITEYDGINQYLKHKWIGDYPTT